MKKITACVLVILLLTFALPMLMLFAASFFQNPALRRGSRDGAASACPGPHRARHPGSDGDAGLCFAGVSVAQ